MLTHYPSPSQVLILKGIPEDMPLEDLGEVLKEEVGDHTLVPDQSPLPHPTPPFLKDTYGALVTLSSDAAADRAAAIMNNHPAFFGCPIQFAQVDVPRITTYATSLIITGVRPLQEQCYSVVPPPPSWTDWCRNGDGWPLDCPLPGQIYDLLAPHGAIVSIYARIIVPAPTFPNLSWPVSCSPEVLCYWQATVCFFARDAAQRVQAIHDGGDFCGWRIKVRPRSIPGLDFDSDWWKTGQAAVRAAGYSPMSEVALVPPEKLMFHSTSNIGDPMDDSPPW